MAGVTYDKVTKEFGNVKAVNNLNMVIEDKEFLVFVGPSGCGKTTALRLLAGLEEITSGEIRIGDRVVNDVPPKDRDIAMVFQSYALYPHLTVYDNLAFGLKLRKTPKEEIKRRVQEAADILGIGVSRSAEPLFDIPRFFSLTNHCPTLTQSCALKPAPTSPSSGKA
jgi:multiple sugar transport system ATP-binding protein